MTIEITAKGPTEDPRRGLVVEVFRGATGHGAVSGTMSSRVAELTVVGIVRQATASGRPLEWARMPQADRLSQPDPDRSPAVLLYGRRVRIGRPTWAIVPALPFGATNEEVIAHLSTLMFGGNFAHTGDGRFSAITQVYDAIPIHDACKWRNCV